MISFSEVSAFTDTPGQGNRAGVVVEGEGLSDAEMQALARFLGAPETVFVTRLDRDLVRVRYFTPTREIEFCGHATVALGLVLAQQGRRAMVLETLAGHVPLEIELEAGVPARVWMEQPAFERRPLDLSQRDRVSEALGIDPRLLHRGLPVGRASTGNWSAYLPLVDVSVLDALEPDLSGVEAISEALSVSGVYAYAPLGVSRFAARYFAPLVGIDEDPVTGSAGGALFGLLASAGKVPLRGGHARGIVTQGHALGQPGEVEVEVRMNGRAVETVRVGGRAAFERHGRWRR